MDSSSHISNQTRRSCEESMCDDDVVLRFFHVLLRVLEGIGLDICGELRYLRGVLWRFFVKKLEME